MKLGKHRTSVSLSNEAVRLLAESAAKGIGRPADNAIEAATPKWLGRLIEPLLERVCRAYLASPGESRGLPRFTESYVSGMEPDAAVRLTKTLCGCLDAEDMRKQTTDRVQAILLMDSLKSTLADLMNPEAIENVLSVAEKAAECPEGIEKALWAQNRMARLRGGIPPAELL